MDDQLLGKWILVEVEGHVVESKNPPFFEIREVDIRGRSEWVLSGFDGCKRFSGILNDEGLRSPPIHCDDYVELPVDLSDPAGHLATAKIKNGIMILKSFGDKPESTFRKQPR